MKINTLMMISLLALTLNTGASLASEKCENDALYPEISLQELQNEIKAGKVLVIDVNSDTSYKKNHVTGAIHYGSVKDQFASKLPQDKNSLIVAYCGGPMCTAWKKAATQACKLGYTHVKHFKGGIKGWVAAAKQN